jgi:hypothetical protein
MAKRFLSIPDPNPPLQVPCALAYSDSEKAEFQGDKLESQIRPVKVPPMQMDYVKRVRGAMESFYLVPASEQLLTNPTKVFKAIAELKVRKAPRPNGVLNKALINRPRIAVTFLTSI